MVSVFVHRNGATEQADAIDPAWLDPSSGVVCWLDLSGPTDDEFRVLADVFHFHSLALEDARAELHYPKIESYGGYLYVILHGIDFKASQHHFATHDTDFFLGPNYLVTVHDGQTRTIQELHSVCAAERSHPRRGTCRSDAPHRGRDGGSLPSGGRAARGSPGQARERRLREIRGRI